MRLAASAVAAPSSARSTPWLPLSDTALTTHGYPTCAAASSTAPSEAPAGTIRNAGWATPAAPHRARWRDTPETVAGAPRPPPHRRLWGALSAAARPASTRLWQRPRRAAAAAA